MTKSYDASSHFESATDEILEIYTRITGERLDMNIEPTDEEEYWCVKGQLLYIQKQKLSIFA